MKKILKIFFILLGVLVITGGALFLYVGNYLKKSGAVTTGEKIQDYGKEKEALLVIDLQNDITLPDGKIATNTVQSDEAIENINRIISTRRAETVYILHEFKETNPIIKFITKGALRHGDDGSLMDKRIKVEGNNFFIKHISDSFSNKDLNDFLVKNKINHLYIAGADAEYCVDKTIKGALNRKYKISVIKDAIVTKTDEGRNNKIQDFSCLGVEILSTEEALKKLIKEQ
ncbi:MAG TPA: isochorismatase family cysteine hydrolase [Spirochaetota bacterium]|nr:isochorismatase family cysteine hydrolase [Spirochaetota bacterium]